MECHNKEYPTSDFCECARDSTNPKLDSPCGTYFAEWTQLPLTSATTTDAGRNHSLSAHYSDRRPTPRLGQSCSAGHLYPGWQHAYTKMVDNLRPLQLPDHPAMKKLMVYIASLPLQENLTVWKFEMTQVQRAQWWLLGQTHAKCSTFISIL